MASCTQTLEKVFPFAAQSCRGSQDQQGRPPQLVTVPPLDRHSKRKTYSQLSRESGESTVNTLRASGRGAHNCSTSSSSSQWYLMLSCKLWDGALQQMAQLHNPNLSLTLTPNAQPSSAACRPCLYKSNQTCTAAFEQTAARRP